MPFVLVGSCGGFFKTGRTVKLGAWANKTGEAVTPAELFLSSVAACGVELVQVFARQEEFPLRAVAVDMMPPFDCTMWILALLSCASAVASLWIYEATTG